MIPLLCPLPLLTYTQLPLKGGRNLKVAALISDSKIDMGKVRVAGPRIEADAAKAMADSGEAVILDVVASHIWPSMTRTIQGSIRIPPEEIETRFHELPRDKAIIAYCT
jgi:hypothetical protein